MRPAAPPKTRGDKVPDTIPYSLLVELVVTDPEIISELWAKREGRERDEYALGALRLGMLALRQLRGQIDAVAAPLPRQDERRLDDVPLALAPAPSCTTHDTLEDGEEDCFNVEPVEEEFEAAVAGGDEIAAVPSSYWLRRRRSRSRFH
jgi:hypothetical protein